MGCGSKQNPRPLPRSAAALAAMLCFLFFGTAMADSGPCQPADFPDGALSLQGSGLRKVTWFSLFDWKESFDAYCASLYLENPTSSGADILNDGGRKVIVMRYLTRISDDEARSYLSASFDQACEADETHCPDAHSVKASYLGAFDVDVRRGDIGVVEFLKDGLEMRFPSGKVKRVGNEGLSRIVLGIFIGSSPVDPDLKTCLLKGC